MNQFLEAPSSNFARVRDGRASMPLYVDIDLTNARSIAANTALVLPIAANSLYIDADTANVGNAVIHFQDTTLGATSAPMFVSPGFIANVAFTQLLIENLAQPGKRLRIFYGVDIDFQAGVNASIEITGTVQVDNILTVRPEAATGSFASFAALAANTAVAAFLPAANVNGCLLLSAGYLEGNGSALPAVSLIAKSSTPANIIDGEVIMANEIYAGAYYAGASLEQPVMIPAGLGLYFISSLATLGGHARHARWKML